MSRLFVDLLVSLNRFSNTIFTKQGFEFAIENKDMIFCIN